MKTKSKISSAAVIILLIIIFLILRPTGNLVLVISNKLEKFDKRISQNFAKAVARTNDFASYRGNLSLSVDLSSIENSTPHTPSGSVIPYIRIENAIQLGHVLKKFIVQKKFDTKIFDGEIEFDFIPLLNKLYHIFNLHDYYLVVTGYEEKPFPDPENKVNNLKLNGKIYSTVVRLHPLDNSERTIPIGSPNSEEILCNELAVYLYEIFSKGDESIENNDNIVPFSEMSHNFPSLKKTIEGFNILKRGVTHEKCSDLSPQGCIEEARKTFEKALTFDQKNAHARLGLGITYLGKSVDAIGNASAYSISKLIVDAGIQLNIARERSSFIRKLTDSNDWLKLLGMPGYKNLNITNKFLDTLHYYQEASIAFAKADYNEAKDLLAKIKSMPQEFDGFLRSMHYEAELYLSKSQSAAKILLKKFQEQSRADDEDFRWTQSYAFQSCRHSVNPENALSLLDKALGTAPDSISYLDSYVLKAQCLAILKRYDDALETVSTVLNELQTKQHTEEYEGLFLDLGYLFAYLGDYDSAANYFFKAAKFWRGYLDHVRSAPDLEEFRTFGKKEYRWFERKVLMFYDEKNQTK